MWKHGGHNGWHTNCNYSIYSHIIITFVELKNVTTCDFSVDRWSVIFTEHMAVRGKSAHSAGLWSITNVWANLAILSSQDNAAGSRRWVWHPYVTYQLKIPLSVWLWLKVNSPSHCTGCGHFGPFQGKNLNNQIWVKNTEFNKCAMQYCGCGLVQYFLGLCRTVVLSTRSIYLWSPLSKASLKRQINKEEKDVYQILLHFYVNLISVFYNFWSITFGRALPRSLVLSCYVKQSGTSTVQFRGTFPRSFLQIIPP